jgi:hypothetical protein
MNPSTTDPNNDGGFDSRDCVILFIDSEQGEVRPPSPVFLKWAEAERERLAKYGFNLDGTRIQPQNEPDAK